ncbi:hypothetical protein GGR08_001162 [Bartonella fuyuanensis]|uniref:Uncharacterized protein n=1 Tax=Bartonella fuyuanensis TaxID=1460968 RepID=A0A840DUZ3_9HYPH|nr:BID domain-containing T4SS effector [Bartonella fuyuanensis]MBB4076851.1 hypothetical protein [Bartonella fuyuanensis]
MKKDHPHPVLSLSIKDLIKLYDEAAAEISSPEPFQTKASSRSKRLSSIPEENEESLSLLREETVHTPVTRLNPTAPLTRGSAIGKTQKPEMTRTPMISQVSSQKTTRILSEEAITLLLSHYSLIQTYQKEIERLSASTYGNPNILQEKMEEIQKNPTVGEELSWRIAAHPESLAKLPGISIFGLKNRARKQAEENFSTLCVTIDGYTEAVKHAREQLSQAPEQELRNYERLMGTSTVAELLRKPDHLKKESLSKEEISTKVQQHSKVQRYYMQIQYWCTIVFGQSNILQSQIEELSQNPATREVLAQELADSPQSFHKYAGITLCGFKNQARRHAEAGLPHLIDAIDNYTMAITQVKDSILQTQQTKQERCDLSSERTQNLHQQQRLSQAALPSELSTAIIHQEGETSSTQQRETNIRPRKAAIPKAMAFAS